MIGEMSSIPSGGGKPGGKEGAQYFHVWGREASLAGVPRLLWEGFNIPHKNAKFIEFYTSV